MSIPRIVVAGTHSGVGKTTVATGLMAALRSRGLRVQGFKVGPDFIDPTFHHAATGRVSHNLDGWMLSRETNLELFDRATEDADVAVIEGVMGLFDGKQSPSLAGTTAEMAMWLDAGVLLVLDAASMAGSAAAIVHGFDTLVPEFSLAAIVCNRVGSDRHYGFLLDAISARCRPESIGYLPRDNNFTIPDRHLGLHMAGESMNAEKLEKLGAWIEQHLNLDRLLELTQKPSPATRTPKPSRDRKGATHPRIGIARDAAFCFYYQDNLDLLKQYGAELIEFSPISDSELPPDLNGLYLGGGYPELHAAALSANESMRRSISGFVENNHPVYAECGGFMYLTKSIVDVDSREWPMAAIFPTKSRMQKRLAKLGYSEVQCDGLAVRGHEFRYSNMDPMPDHITRAYAAPAEGYRVKSALGSYIHLHFLSCPGFAEKFVGDCAA